MSSKLDKAMKADLDLEKAFKYIITYYVTKKSAISAPFGLNE